MESTYPKQVEEAADMAEELHSLMFNPPKADEGENPESTPDQDEPTSDEQPSEDLEADDSEINELRKFKERYLHLQGKYDAEVPRLHQEIREFKENVIKRLEQQAATQAKPVEEEDWLAKERLAYDDELLSVIEKIADRKSKDNIKAELAPVQQQITHTEETQHAQQTEKFVSYLDEVVKGDWKALWAGKDPGFIEFLQQPDSTGINTYLDHVNAYNQTFDAQKMASVFNLYLQTINPEPVLKPKIQRPDDVAMIAPSRTNSNIVPKSENARIWTTDSMKEFQTKDRQGKYSTEESAALWADLVAAASENRIR